MWKMKRTEQVILLLKKQMSKTGLKVGSNDSIVSQDKITTILNKSVASTDAIDQILGPMPSVNTGADVQDIDASVEGLFGVTKSDSKTALPETVAAVTFAARMNHSGSEVGHSEVGYSSDEPSDTPGNKSGTPVTSTTAIIKLIGSLQKYIADLTGTITELQTSQKSSGVKGRSMETNFDA